MGWEAEAEKLVPFALVIGLGFGIVFLILGSFQNSIQSTNPTVANDIGTITQAFANPIQQYLGLIVTILFLVLMFVVAMWGIHRARKD